jgi:hypothetical protein
MDADVEAYEITRRSEAEKKAAIDQAEAVRTKAQADKDADVLRAEGKKASDMIPVDVDKAKVEVERARVDVKREEVAVLKEELEAKTEHSEIAKELEIALAQINADKEVNIERARSTGIAFSKAEMTIFGDPQTLAQMMQSFNKGQSMGAFGEGLVTQTPEKIQNGVSKALGATGSAIKGLIKKIAGIDVDDENLEAIVEELKNRGLDIESMIKK